MEMSKTLCFLVATPSHGMVTPSICTTEPPIQALRWLTAASTVSWPGWTQMAIPTNRTIVASGKISLRSLMQLGFNSNRVAKEEES